MGKNKGQFKKGRGPFNFSHDKVKEEKTGIDETEKQKTDPEIDDNGVALNTINLNLLSSLSLFIKQYNSTLFCSQISNIFHNISLSYFHLQNYNCPVQ
jgi:hypothetical protein